MTPANKRRSRSLVALSCALFGSALSVPALASPAYPPFIQAQLGLAQAPPCTLCHRDDAGGAGTVVRPFGRTMIGHFQLSGGSNTAALSAALAGDDGEHLDSDNDGIPDIDELRAGSDPNVGVSGVEATPDVPLPETGCALRPGVVSGVDIPSLWVLVGLALGGRRRIRDLFLRPTRGRH